MARRVRSTDLENRSARSKLKVRGKPYYKVIGQGLHLGYRRGARRGMWVVRRYAGGSTYTVETIAEADDHVEADGVNVLTYWQAQDLANKKAGRAPTRSGPYKVADAIRDYLVKLEGQASHNDTKLRLEAYALPELGDLHVDKLKADVLRHWHKNLAKAPKRVRTKKGAVSHSVRDVDLNDPEIARQRKVSANRILGLLKAALNHAFHEDKVADDKEWRKVKPFPKVDRSRTRFLDFAECRRLLHASDKEFRPLVRAALETGCRYGELCRLRVEDFNRDSGTLRIWLSKSGEARHVVLTDEAQAFFTQLTAGHAGAEPMFGRVWGPSDQLRRMKDACKNARIVPAVGFHQLRHTYASLAIMNGMPLPVVAKNLGHADTRMCERHYGHVAETYVTKAVRDHAPRYGVDEPSKVRAL